MMAYPALVAARRLVRRRPAQAVVGAWALAAWDLFLDPQMVDAGHWAWADPDPALPGVHGVPVSNYLGWLAVALVLMAALSLLPRRRTEDGVPVALYLWTFAGSVLANLVWFDRPAVALWGGLGMGLVAVPLCRTVLSPPRP
jgi:putative membrane protein